MDDVAENVAAPAREVEIGMMRQIAHRVLVGRGGEFSFSALSSVSV
jgi:hypothetical protein